MDQGGSGMKLLMSAQEYLSASFDGPDREFVDGEVVERSMGEIPHGRIQKRLLMLIERFAEQSRIESIPEIRIQISASRYRVADIAVWRAGEIGSRIPTVPPFLAIEILSPEDRMVRVMPKIEEYFSIGVEHVWVIDPEERAAMSFTPRDRGGSLTGILATSNPDLQIAVADLMSVLD